MIARGRLLFEGRGTEEVVGKTFPATAKHSADNHLRPLSVYPVG